MDQKRTDTVLRFVPNVRAAESKGRQPTIGAEWIQQVEHCARVPLYWGTIHLARQCELVFFNLGEILPSYEGDVKVARKILFWCVEHFTWTKSESETIRNTASALSRKDVQLWLQILNRQFVASAKVIVKKIRTTEFSLVKYSGQKQLMHIFYAYFLALLKPKSCTAASRAR